MSNAAIHSPHPFSSRFPPLQALSAPTTAGAFGKAAESVCAVSADSLPAKYPSVSAADAPFMCLDLSYCHAVLTQGFKLAPEKSITLVRA